MQSFYTFIVYPILYFIFQVLSFFNPKIKKGLELRKGKSWLKTFPSGTSWVWFHVASGELEYAKPVMRLLKQNQSFHSKILVTYFSPSVKESLTKTKEVDLFVPMPWDTPWHWNEFLDHYHPKVLAIARTDAWPNMVWQAHKKKVPSLLFSATLARNSGRVSSFWGRLFYGSVMEKLSSISCVTEEDRELFERLGDDLSLSVDGDTRFDQVIARLEEKRALPSWLDRLKTPVFVAGSTWPEDERILLPSLTLCSANSLVVLIAPHEPTPKHLEKLEGDLEALGLKSKRWSELSEGNPKSTQGFLEDTDTLFFPIVLVDRIGILADLYRYAQFAFVGGSFRKTIHSVMEPAAAGCLTLMGPFNQNNREAQILKAGGMALEIENTPELKKAFGKELLLSQEEVLSRKARIIGSVQKSRGASQKVTQWLLEHLF